MHGLPRRAAQRRGKTCKAATGQQRFAIVRSVAGAAELVAVGVTYLAFNQHTEDALIVGLVFSISFWHPPLSIFNQRADLHQPVLVPAIAELGHLSRRRIDSVDDDVDVPVRRIPMRCPDDLVSLATEQVDHHLDGFNHLRLVGLFSALPAYDDVLERILGPWAAARGSDHLRLQIDERAALKITLAVRDHLLAGLNPEFAQSLVEGITGQRLDPFGGDDRRDVGVDDISQDVANSPGEFPE
ncbi:MAG: hypothetical protein H7316_15910 [Tardiphaga sp.]|nr:hypothetical protein [Tardiphaga sp.]MBC7585229.1 hypothetical protein [Tardiphaga sp.]